MNSPTIEALAHRIERLELECRRWRRGGMAVTALGILCLMAGGALKDDNRKVIEAQEIILKDAQGRPRIYMGAESSSGPYLNFRDQNEDGRLLLIGGRGDEGAGISVRGQRDRGCLNLGIQNGHPYLYLEDDDGKAVFRAASPRAF